MKFPEEVLKELKDIEFIEFYKDYEIYREGAESSPTAVCVYKAGTLKTRCQVKDAKDFNLGREEIIRCIDAELI